MSTLDNTPLDELINQYGRMVAQAEHDAEQAHHAAAAARRSEDQRSALDLAIRGRMRRLGVAACTHNGVVYRADMRGLQVTAAPDAHRLEAGDTLDLDADHQQARA